MTYLRLSKRVLFHEYIGFSSILLFLWLNEILDIPHVLGGQATPINSLELLIETVIIVIWAVLVISSTHQLLARIEQLTLYDELTGALNRKYMVELLKGEVHRSTCSQSSFSIILADIDHFKSVNDQFGHEGGDQLLQHISKMFKENLRTQDTICRWGGDEILILLPETSLENARKVAEKLRKKVESSPLIYNNQEIIFTVSFGVHDHKPVETSFVNCIREADMNLYEAKRCGRNRVISIRPI